MISQHFTLSRPSPQGVHAGRANAVDLRPIDRRTAVKVDLSRYTLDELNSGCPREFKRIQHGVPVELLFPKGMRTVPFWVADFNVHVVRLPEFAGNEVTVRGKPTRVEVGGTTVRTIVAPAGCNVSVPDKAHSGPVTVAWLDSEGRVFRTGHPQNHVNRAAARRSDASMPGNGTVRFGTPWHRDERVECRHLAAWAADHATSASEGEDDDADAHKRIAAGPRHSPPVERHAAHARNRLATPERLRSAIPYAYEARYYDLVARSNNATVVDNDLFPDWIKSQLQTMKPSDRRSYLLLTDKHVVNVTLSVVSGIDGKPAYGVMLKDPNLLTTPHAIETSDLDDVGGWKLERLFAPGCKDFYFGDDVDGEPQNTSLLVETPRGEARKSSNLGESRHHAPPRLHFFPPSLPASGNDLRFNGVVGAYLDSVSESLTALAPGKVYDRLKGGGQIVLRFANGNAAEITNFFSLVRRLVTSGRLSSDDAVLLVAPLREPIPTHAAIIEGRADALFRYRNGLKSLIEDGVIDPGHRRLFAPLFAKQSTDVMAALRHGGTPSQRRAAHQYDDLLRLVEEHMGRG